MEQVMSELERLDSARRTYQIYGTTKPENEFCIVYNGKTMKYQTVSLKQWVDYKLSFRPDRRRTSYEDFIAAQNINRLLHGQKISLYSL